MRKAELELALSAAGRVARDREFIVFGSQSILGTVSRPPKSCLTSQEVDLYPRTHPQAVGLIVAELGRRSPFARENGFFIDCVTPEVAAFPDGWSDRLVAFRTKRTGGVTGWCIELHDVAASKLAAGRKKDLEYVRTLLSSKLISPLVLRRRVSALPVNHSQRESLLHLVKSLVQATRPKKTPQRKKK